MHLFSLRLIMLIQVFFLYHLFILIRRVHETFDRVRTLEGVLGYSSLFGARGEALWQKIVLGYLKGLSEPSRHATKHYELHLVFQKSNKIR